ncbi:hypothetical protein Ae201684_011086 [Aphanomyces euteiches]|uniref:Uncharacterized protein n=1 Tax=Aphanomyces euteiches TaxID=100861 RepID=A0A6G0WW61_9STRA|nr:hypothetical protein Ae201684_011086 [Aphanomyces euteiches]
MNDEIVYHALEIKYSSEDLPHLEGLIEKAKVSVEKKRQQRDLLIAEAAERRQKLDQLANDELAIRNQHEALKGRFKLQRRLSDVGGHENTLKVLMDNLATTKQDIAQVRQTKATLVAAHKEMEKEHANLVAAIKKSEANIQAISQDRALFESKKGGVEAKLTKIAAFLMSST